MSSKQDKTRLSEEKANLFRDSKRRIVYPINNTDQAYVVHPDDVGKVLFYDTRIVIALLPIALIFGLFGRYLFEATVFGTVLYFATEIAFKKMVFSKFRVIKLKPEDYAYCTRPEILKLKRKEKYIRGLLSLIILILVVNFVIVIFAESSTDGYTLVTSIIAIALIFIVSIIELKDIVTLTKLIKASK